MSHTNETDELLDALEESRGYLTKNYRDLMHQLMDDDDISEDKRKSLYKKIFLEERKINAIKRSRT